MWTLLRGYMRPHTLVGCQGGDDERGGFDANGCTIERTELCLLKNFKNGDLHTLYDVNSRLSE